MFDQSQISPRALAAWLAAALMGFTLAGRAAADAPPATRPAVSPSNQPADNALTVGADPSVDAKPDQIAKWFSQLDDADAKVREAAYSKLMALKSADLVALKHAVKESLPLRPAQESALPGIVKQLFLSGYDYDGDDEGFLGVTIEDRDIPGQPQGTPHEGLLVTHCMPGFCGARALRDGDVILSILERPDVKVDGSSAFAQTIRAVGAGHLVHLSVLRQGQVIKVAVTLNARPNDLNENASEFTVQDMLAHRDNAAEEYWAKDFAPLFKSGAS